MQIMRLVDWLFGCSHRRTTFPRTSRVAAGAGAGQAAKAETYVACLQCGRQIPYDWVTMRTGVRQAAGTGLVPVTSAALFQPEAQGSARTL